MDSGKLILIRGANCFTRLDLIKKAANIHGITFRDSSRYRIASDPIKRYELTYGILEFLATKGFVPQPRPDVNEEIFTLVDTNPQEHRPGWAASNYWNFKKRDDGTGMFDAVISLAVELRESMEQRGVIFEAVANGTFVSPADRLPHVRMFEALTSFDNNPPPLTKLISGNNGQIVVSWTELGLGGIRTIGELFREFCGGKDGKEEIVRLGETSRVFNPRPYDPRFFIGDDFPNFVAEHTQPLLFETWRKQLDDYRRSLEI